VCGIALILGPEADLAGELFERMLAALAPRGEILETRRGPGLLAGTQRLRIVDRDAAVQPWTSADGRWVLCYNGELFNYRELAAQLTALGAGRSARRTRRS
jgi:asparagine synthase (glutamine-hydrolysing)